MIVTSRVKFKSTENTPTMIHIHSLVPLHANIKQVERLGGVHGSLNYLQLSVDFTRWGQPLITLWIPNLK